MSPERSHAYKRVMDTLDELGPSKLLSEEQDRIRYAADNLIFSGDLAGEEAAAALGDALTLCQGLVSSGRWEPVTATRLAEDISACGPAREPVGHAA
ncbi:MAG: hypothetical protein M3010_10050 [Candidatus Dormibacteraeota bacterium]|nr:hypothetical protein [Candidatus Dormibacteraeota bacterium]